MASRRKSSDTSPTSIHALRIELVDSHPNIWREVHVPSNFTLGQVHNVIQRAFGWENAHLHMFEDRKRRRYGPPGDDDFEQDMLDEDKYTVADLGPRKGSAFGYIYDFGDDWVHRITVKAIQQPEPGRRYPACVAGKRAGPPEDSGGVYGYQTKLEAIANPKDPDREELLQWLGDSFDPDAFDINAADKAVRSAR